MTDLRTLLHESAAEPARSLDLDALTSQARRRPWRRLAIWLGSLGALIGGAFGAPLVLQPSSPDRTSIGIERPGGPNKLVDDQLPSVIAAADRDELPAHRNIGFGPRSVPVESQRGTDDVVTAHGPLIAYSEIGGTEDNGAIHVFDPTARTDRIIGYGEMPSFSPDGRRIVYFVTPLANTCGNDPCPAQGTYVKALDERGPGNRISPYGEYPDWSPTGDRIVFTKYGTDAPAGAEPQLQVYVVNADGSGERRLTNSLTRTAADPAWSPDGSKIVFVGQDNGAPGLGSASSSLYVMNADGTDLHAIAGTSGASLSPTWSPDGTRVAYMVRATSGSVAPKTRIVDLRTGRVAPLADDWNVGWPAWSADGAIAVAKDVGPGGTGPTSVGVSVWLMNSDGTNRRQLVGPNQNGVGYLAFSRR